MDLRKFARKMVKGYTNPYDPNPKKPPVPKGKSPYYYDYDPRMPDDKGTYWGEVTLSQRDPVKFRKNVLEAVGRKDLTVPKPYLIDWSMSGDKEISRALLKDPRLPERTRKRLQAELKGK